MHAYLASVTASDDGPFVSVWRYVSGNGGQLFILVVGGVLLLAWFIDWENRRGKGKE